MFIYSTVSPRITNVYRYIRDLFNVLSSVPPGILLMELFFMFLLYIRIILVNTVYFLYMWGKIGYLSYNNIDVIQSVVKSKFFECMDYLIFSVLHKDKISRRIGNAMEIHYYHEDQWKSLLVPTGDDQYTIVTISSDNMVLRHCVPKGMKLMVNEDDFPGYSVDIL